jgi:hypothetical protein
MHTYITSSRGCEGNLPRPWHIDSTEISSEFIIGTFTAQALPSPSEVDMFEREGIAVETLHKPTPIRIGRVVFTANGFEIEPFYYQEADGEQAYLFIVADRQGCACDIIAWALESGRVAAWLNRAWALGQETIHRPRLTNHRGLHVWRSPWGWLRASRNGIVPIRASAVPFQLDCAGPLIAEDVPHGLELQKMLTPAIPRILVAIDGRLS